MSSATTGNAPRVRFNVAYTWAEYKSIVLEFLVADMARRAKAKGKAARAPGPASLWLVLALASVMFVYKRYRMPEHVFTIDGEQILRTNKLGTIRVSWRDVDTVYRFKHAYLVIKNNGGLPLPYRCLTPAQKDVLEIFVKAREQELLQSGTQ